MIRIDNLTRRFGDRVAVDHLTLEIAPGEIFGLVGPDGAGKTTTLRVLCGLLDPSEGAVSIGGQDIAKNLDSIKDRIGYMAQRFGLYGDLTVEENLWFYGDLFGVTGSERDDLMRELLDLTRMTPFRRRAAANLSGGMKQKLALMCTLLHHPQVLILDEPTNGVDPISRRDFWDILYRLAGEGMTVLVSTAYLDEAERCARVGLMNHGRIIRCDTPRALKAHVAPGCYRAEAADLRAARKKLLGLRGVVGAEPAGARLHVYLDDPASKPEVERQAPGVRLEPIAPSLEDVFIALIRAEERHARG